MTPTESSTSPNGNGHLLARIDERTLQLLRAMEQLRADLAAHEAHVQRTHVTRAEFRPIRAVIYGLVGLALTGAGGSVLTLVLR